MTSNERGQTTLELALCLPVVVAIFAALVQVALIGMDQVRLWHAAREAARVAAVDPDEAAIEDAARTVGLVPLDVSVQPRDIYRRRGEPVTVSLEHPPVARVPLVGALFGSLRLTAEASMRIEQP